MAVAVAVMIVTVFVIMVLVVFVMVIVFLVMFMFVVLVMLVLTVKEVFLQGWVIDLLLCLFLMSMAMTAATFTGTVVMFTSKVVVSFTRM